MFSEYLMAVFKVSLCTNRKPLLPPNRSEKIITIFSGFETTTCLVLFRMALVDSSDIPSTVANLWLLDLKGKPHNANLFFIFAFQAYLCYIAHLIVEPKFKRVPNNVTTVNAPKWYLGTLATKKPPLNVKWDTIWLENNQFTV